jgi:hypothetical protein
MALPDYESPRDGNHVPAAIGQYNATPPTITDGDLHALQLDSSGNLLVNVAVGGGGGGTSTSANLYTGSATLNTTQVQLDATSHALSNGIIIKTPSSNAANVYVGLTGVTTTTGDVLEPGESRGYAVNNTNLLYIISSTSTTDIVTFSAN